MIHRPAHLTALAALALAVPASIASSRPAQYRPGQPGDPRRLHPRPFTLPDGALVDAPLAADNARLSRAEAKRQRKAATRARLEAARQANVQG